MNLYKCQRQHWCQEEIHPHFDPLSRGKFAGRIRKCDNGNRRLEYCKEEVMDPGMRPKNQCGIGAFSGNQCCPRLALSQMKLISAAWPIRR